MQKLKFIGSRPAVAACVLAFLPAVAPAPAQQTANLNPTQFVVVGEGLAAGMGDFALKDVYQQSSFPALMAAQMQTAFPQPLLQAPGVSYGAPGFQALPAGYPVTLQGSVRDDFPPDLFVFNLATPGATLSDALNYTPAYPLIQPNNPKQTLTNLILGYPTLIIGQTLPLWSQVQYAVAMNPTLVVVELGYYEVLNAAATNNPALLPNPATFATNYAAMLSQLKTTGPQIVVTTIPDPFDTAYFTSVNEATNFLSGAPPATISLFLAMGPNDYFTPAGIMQAATQLLTGTVNPIFSPFSALPGVSVTAATQTAVEANLAALNAAIKSAAQAAGPSVIVFDLQSLLHQIRLNGLTIGSTTLTADYLGGFYTLDGYYPGQTGQALIANQLLSLLNSTNSTSFPLVNLTTVAASDPALRAVPSARTVGQMVNPRGVPVRKFDMWRNLK